MNNSTYSSIYANQKKVGEVQSNVFRKRIKFSRHALRRPPALAFDVTSLQDAEEAGACIVEVIDAETNRVYFAPIKKIWERGFVFNRGFGNQIALPLHLWKTDCKAGSPPINPSSGDGESSVTQLELFD